MVDLPPWLTGGSPAQLFVPDALRTLAGLLEGNPTTCLHPYTASGGERALAAAIEVAADAEVRVAAPDPSLVAWPTRSTTSVPGPSSWASP